MAGRERIPVVMTVAGSDSGGGAGIQADLKAFARCGVHGTSAIVAITAQNTLGVSSVHPVPPEMIREQVKTVSADLGIDAVKVGMLGDEPTIEAVVAALGDLEKIPIVVDPVMVAESGAILLDPEARLALVARIVPQATVITPNLPEARALTALGEDASHEELARAVHALGPGAVVVTGGHSREGVDLFFDGETLAPIEGPVHPAGASHGSGCTHSSALAARMALGDSPLEAARAAREIAAEAVGNGLPEIGEGTGPVDVLDVRDRQ
jgi:hydroxymethylpyrimidine/phosphomethylpyrimidine kinase